MEKTIEELKTDKAFLSLLLMQVVEELKTHGKIDGDRKVDGFTMLDHIEAGLDNVGALEAVAEYLAKTKLEHLEWYRARGRFVFPDMEPPKGYMP